MPLTKEIWLNHIVETLFPEDSFVEKAFNADDFVTQGGKVHVPNAAAKPEVVKGPIAKPATASNLQDTDLDFSIDELYVKPIYIENAEKYELSYDKRQSVLQRAKNALSDGIANLLISKWLPTKEEHTFKTKKLTKEDVLALQTKMNEENIPQEGRYLLLNATMYADLLKDLTGAQSNAFLASADAAKGILGKLFGFNIMLRSKVVDGEGKSCGLAWHEDYVCRAKGEHEMFIEEQSPEYYGDVFSFLVRVGGAKMSKDEVGVYKLVIDPSAV